MGSTPPAHRHCRAVPDPRRRGLASRDPAPDSAHVPDRPPRRAPARDRHPAGDGERVHRQGPARWAATLSVVDESGNENEPTFGYRNTRPLDGVDDPSPVPAGTDDEATIRMHPRDSVVPAGAVLELTLSNGNDRVLQHDTYATSQVQFGEEGTRVHLPLDPGGTEWDPSESRPLPRALARTLRERSRSSPRVPPSPRPTRSRLHAAGPLRRAGKGLFPETCFARGGWTREDAAWNRGYRWEPRWC
jgi:hypothetical protein